MDQQILNATITIEEIVDKGKKISIKGNSGRVHTYSIWKTKQDGSDSVPYSQFKTMGLQVGSTVVVGYVVDEYDTEINGILKRIQSKKIINFRETNSEPTQPSQTEKSLNSGAPRASGRALISEPDGSYEARDKAFGRRLGVQGHINALLSNSSYYTGNGVVGAPPSIAALVAEAIAVEDEAEKQLNPSKFRETVQAKAPQVVDDELPVIQVEGDEVDVESIPF